MSQVPKDIRKEFIVYLNKCREIYRKELTNEYDIDTEVSSITSELLKEFEIFRLFRVREKSDGNTTDQDQS